MQTEVFLLDAGDPPLSRTHTPPSLTSYSPTPRKTYRRPSFDSDQPKKYVTNSDKSVYNLKWQVGGKKQKYYRRGQSQEKITLPAPKHRQQRYTSQDPRRIISSTRVPVSKRPVETVPRPIVVARPSPPPPPKPPSAQKPSYPYAYPPMSDAVRLMMQPVDPTKPRLIARVQHIDKPLNLLQATKQLRIEHHYVDSPGEAEKVIDELRRKGFVETGIQTTETDGDEDED